VYKRAQEQPSSASPTHTARSTPSLPHDGLLTRRPARHRSKAQEQPSPAGPTHTRAQHSTPHCLMMACSPAGSPGSQPGTAAEQPSPAGPTHTRAPHSTPHCLMMARSLGDLPGTAAEQWSSPHRQAPRMHMLAKPAPPTTLDSALHASWTSGAARSWACSSLRRRRSRMWWRCSW